MDIVIIVVDFELFWSCASVRNRWYCRTSCSRGLRNEIITCTLPAILTLFLTKTWIFCSFRGLVQKAPTFSRTIRVQEFFSSQKEEPLHIFVHHGRLIWLDLFLRVGVPIITSYNDRLLFFCLRYWWQLNPRDEGHKKTNLKRCKNFLNDDNDFQRTVKITTKLEKVLVVIAWKWSTIF